jgi:hypothetical protein
MASWSSFLSQIITNKQTQSFNSFAEVVVVGAVVLLVVKSNVVELKNQLE